MIQPLLLLPLVNVPVPSGPLTIWPPLRIVLLRKSRLPVFEFSVKPPLKVFWP